MVFIEVEAVERLHDEVIKVSGGSAGLRDRGLLESAVNRARNKALYDPTATFPQLAASLAYGLIKNHAFVDGNKRIGLATMIAFLHINGYTTASTELEEIEMVQKTASNEISEDQWSAWVESIVRATE